MLLSLPDDVFAIVCRFLLQRDVCNLSLCCRSLYTLVACDKVWFTQCDMLGIVPCNDLVEWRKGVSSYKALCRFLVTIRPLVGIWVHQNPELGNVVYVMPGFISVVGCRIIPQELGPLGIEDGPIHWAPVFEVIGDFDGSTIFFLHGTEEGNHYIYPGSVKPIERACNVLLLEVENREQKYVTNSGLSRSNWVIKNNEVMVPFSKLGFSDRRKLLEVTTNHIQQKVPDMAIGPLFPRLREDEDNFQKDLVLLRERRYFLIQLFQLGTSQVEHPQEVVDSEELKLDYICKSLYCSRALRNPLQEEVGRTQCIKKRSLGGYIWNNIKHILGRSSTINGSSENKHARLHEFLRSSDTLRLTLHASTVKLSSYRAWPNMHDSRFALYKMPMRVPKADHEYAGLWGGTFGWPPGKPTEDKPGKALFFLLLSYEESHGQQLLIATKILEGTHYVLHPNGSAMFVANINKPSSEPFPWETNADFLPMNIEYAFMGEGIANGYGFRYPGSKPGSLYIFQNGIIAFLWKESRAVLTLQRLNLQELLKKGERISALPPIANFSYLTKSYSNVYAGFPISSTCFTSPR
ncbi:F-box protein [Senna tora]|uniref:F-box protein n=1 Tax=Senna tora TaxID=362788 RepID=A0A834WXC3_9FABA|nr:F-box protein [Senna tora]